MVIRTWGILLTLITFLNSGAAAAGSVLQQASDHDGVQRLSVETDISRARIRSLYESESGIQLAIHQAASILAEQSRQQRVYGRTVLNRSAGQEIALHLRLLRAGGGEGAFRDAFVNIVAGFAHSLGLAPDQNLSTYALGNVCFIRAKTERRRNEGDQRFGLLHEDEHCRFVITTTYRQLDRIVSRHRGVLTHLILRSLITSEEYSLINDALNAYAHWVTEVYADVAGSLRLRASVQPLEYQRFIQALMRYRSFRDYNGSDIEHGSHHALFMFADLDPELSADQAISEALRAGQPLNVESYIRRWLAKRTVWGRPVALSVPLREFMPSPADVEQVYAEYQLSRTEVKSMPQVPVSIHQTR